LQHIWKAQDQKLDRLLALNQELLLDVTRQKFNQQLSRLNRPKRTAILLGVPYTLLLAGVTSVALLAGAYLVALGFGAIALIMAALTVNYMYQLHLIRRVQQSDGLLSTQRRLSQLRISSFRNLHLAVFQLPFWSICWISLDELVRSPLLYGGINLVVFALLTYLSYWLYQQLGRPPGTSKVRDLLLSGREWEPIQKSEELLDQIKEYEG